MMFKTSLGHAEAFRFMISPLIDMVSAKSRTSGVCVSTLSRYWRPVAESWRLLSSSAAPAIEGGLLSLAQQRQEYNPAIRKF